MRTHTVSINDGRIIKQYSTTPGQQEAITARFDEYIAWVQRYGFAVPDTKLNTRDGLLEVNQQYIEGRPITRDDWVVLLSKLMKLPETMDYGFDAGPANFLFVDDIIYFVDFYPLFVRDDPGFLASQFPYGEKLVVQRYFNKWSVIVCFLNRLKITHPEAFMTCVAIICTAIQPHLFELPGRDVRRLSRAIVSRHGEFCDFYENSKTDEKPATLSEVNHLRLLLIEQSPEGLLLDSDIASRERREHIDTPLIP